MNDSGASRGIRVIEQFSGLPIVGRVAAGEPILAEQNIEDYQEVPANTFHPFADYFLRVQGQSMIDVGIMDGDLLAVHQQPTADNQQIVVARVDGEVTVKRLKPLEANTKYSYYQKTRCSPIVVDLRHQDFAIEGLAVGVLGLLSNSAKTVLKIVDFKLPAVNVYSVTGLPEITCSCKILSITSDVQLWYKCHLDN